MHTIAPLFTLRELNDILEGCRLKNPKAQELLFNAFSRPLFGVCLRYIKDRDDAEDVLQESFIKIFNNIGSFRAEGSFEGWARRITANTALYFLKQKKRFTFVHNTVDRISDTAEEEEEIDDVDTESIVAGLHKLPDGYRVVLNLYLMENYSHAEIAEKLGIKEATSRSQYFKARKYLLSLVNNKKGVKEKLK